MSEAYEEDVRHVRGPSGAVAWAVGRGALPGRWLYDERDAVRAEDEGETVLRTELDNEGRPWLWNVTGHASQADLIQLTTEVEQLLETLVAVAEDAADALSRQPS